MQTNSLHGAFHGLTPSVSNAWEDAAEAAVEASLPPIPSLQGTTTQEQRLAVYSKLIATQRANFIEAHGGDPFGIERRSEPRPEGVSAVVAMSAPAASSQG